MTLIENGDEFQGEKRVRLYKEARRQAGKLVVRKPEAVQEVPGSRFHDDEWMLPRLDVLVDGGGGPRLLAN